MEKFKGIVILNRPSDVVEYEVGQASYGCITSVARQQFGVLLIEESFKDTTGKTKYLQKLQDAKQRIENLIAILNERSE